MEEIINFLTEFCNLHSSLAYIFGFLFLCFVDNKLPEDSKYKNMFLKAKGITI